MTLAENSEIVYAIYRELFSLERELEENIGDILEELEEFKRAKIMINEIVRKYGRCGEYVEYRKYK